MADLTDTIVDAAGSPLRATVDGNSGEARSIDDLIKADQYLAGKAAASLRSRGLRFTKLIAPGQTGVHLREPDRLGRW